MTVTLLLVSCVAASVAQVAASIMIAGLVAANRLGDEVAVAA